MKVVQGRDLPGISWSALLSSDNLEQNDDPARGKRP
jgi:hypothetical protein